MDNYLREERMGEKGNKRLFIIILFLILTIIFTQGLSAKIVLKEVQKIGSDKTHYDFFLIGSVDIDKSGNIYVLDLDSFMVRKYDKNGKFISESGRKGNGPGEFMYPTKIFVKEDKIYVSDFTLRQINVFDRKLKFIKVIKLLESPYNFCICENKIIIATIKTDRNETFSVFDLKGNKKRTFFSEQPYFLKKIKKDKMFIAFKLSYAMPMVDFAVDKKEIALVFRLYDNHNKLYLIDINGNIKKNIPLEFKEKYEIPWFLFKYPPISPNKYTLIGIDSIHYYKDRYVFVNYKISEVKKIGNKKQSKNRSYVIVVDTKTGKIIDKTEIPSEMRILKIKGDYMYAKNFDDDIETLHIYKIRLEK